MVDSYTAQDIITCKDYQGEWILSDFATGSVAELSAPNDLSSTSTGYNGNSLGAHNEPGRQRELTLLLVKAGNDDKRINKNYNMWKNRDLRFKPLEMTFTKNVGHSDGSITADTVKCFFGLPSGQTDQVMNTEGDTQQVTSQYVIRFGNSERSL